MCRMLVVDQKEQSLLQEKTRMYVHLLGLPVELQYADSYASACRSVRYGMRIDILVARYDPEAEASVSEPLRSAQPWIKRVLITEKAAGREFETGKDLLLPSDMDPGTFYRAIEVLAPETARKAADVDRVNQWYSNSADRQDRILEVLRIIKEEYWDDLSLTYLASRVYTSPCYLSTLFHKFVGVSPLAYLNDYRMRQAVQLLLDTDSSVTAICRKVGYRNLPYFCTCFKNKYGTTPAQFREQFKLSAAV